MFDGGYVHRGLLRVAGWLLDLECSTLKRLLIEYPDYNLTFGGHSLGSGVAALMTVLVLNNLHEFEGLSRSRVTCYAIAPARCMSMNLAVKYADVIKSIILQDDFLPRTSVPLQMIFGAAFCLPCLLTLTCCKETFTSPKKKFRDPRRLYVPGRLYHIVYTKFGSFNKYPAEVRTAIPITGRFENLVCSKNATEDHSLIAIEKKVTEAYEVMLKVEEEVLLAPPSIPTMSRLVSKLESQAMEHEHALQDAVNLGVANALNSYESHMEKQGNQTPQRGETVSQRVHTAPRGVPSPTSSTSAEACFHGNGGEEEKAIKRVADLDAIEEQAPTSTISCEQVVQNTNPFLEDFLPTSRKKKKDKKGKKEGGGKLTLRGRMRKAAKQRAEEEKMIQEEQQRAELARENTTPLSKWDDVIHALTEQKSTKKKRWHFRKNAAAPKSNWGKARAAFKVGKLKQLNSSKRNEESGEDNAQTGDGVHFAQQGILELESGLTHNKNQGVVEPADTLSELEMHQSNELGGVTYDGGIRRQSEESVSGKNGTGNRSYEALEAQDMSQKGKMNKDNELQEKNVDEIQEDENTVFEEGESSEELQEEKFHDALEKPEDIDKVIAMEES